MAKSKTLHAYNGQTRGDGFDAHMRPVNRRDNAPGGATHRVQFVSVMDGRDIIVWRESEEEARHATLYGSAVSA